jgi:Fe(3+) dicitrate transport protein
MMRLSLNSTAARLALVAAALGANLPVSTQATARAADTEGHATTAVDMASGALEADAVAEAGGGEADTPQTVVVIGTRQSLQEIPGSGATIEAQDLIRARVFTVNEALRQAPGVFPRDEEGLGLRPNIGIRGLSPTRSTKVLLLEDGLPLSYAPYGDNASYYHPPVRRFARIEVLKGASQVRFGPSTIGGVINYVTPDAYTEPTFKLMAAGGSRGYHELDISTGTDLFGFGTLLHANLTGSDGSRDNQDLSISDLYFKAERSFGPHALTVRLSRSTEDSQITYSGLTAAEWAVNPRGNPFVNDVFEIVRAGGSLTWGWQIGDGVELNTSVHGSWFDRDWWRQSSNSGQRPNDASDPACGGMAGLLTTCGNEGRLREYNTYGAETRLTLERDVGPARVSVETGLRLARERQRRLQVNSDTPTGRTPGTSVNGGVRENNLRYADATALFASARVDFGRFAVLPGLRYEAIAYERDNRLSGARGSTDFEEWIPGLGLRFDLTDTMTAYAGVHRGFAPPRVEDVISNATGGSLELDSERSTNWELGVRGEVRPGIAVDLAWFRMDFENQIVPASVAGGSGATLTGAGETLHTGVEASVRGSLRDMGLMDGNDVFFRGALTWVAEASYQGARFSAVPGFGTTSVTGNRLPYSPELLVSAAVGYAWGEVAELQVEFVHTGDMYTDDLNTVAETADGQRGLIEGYTVWNATLNVEPPSWPVGFFFTVKNLTDELYVADRSRGKLPGTPRLIQAGISYDF